MKTSVYSGEFRTGHCQGIAVDEKNGYIYYSFTTAVIKTDMEGRLISSAYGLLGHLGCIAFNSDDGKLYGSLEYKNDVIGQGIMKRYGSEAAFEEAFYMAVFDVDKMTEINMDAAGDGIMRCAYLKDVVDDYNAVFTDENGKELKHRHGCSGIDGTAIGPAFGSESDKRYLYVTYGVYGDVSRADNDYQVMHCYDIDTINETAMPLSQENMHRSGPGKPLHKYFIFTGNTDWGVQNVEYDSYTDKYFLCVYPGHKKEFKNPYIFTLTRGQKPEYVRLEGVYPETIGEILKVDSMDGIMQNLGSTGIYSCSDGHFWISEIGRTEDRADFTYVNYYSFSSEKMKFEKVSEN